MTIRFAMARNRRRFRNLPWRPTTANLSAANDNDFDTEYSSTLKTALRYFARHGLSAPDAVQREAVEAMMDRDEPSFRKWLEICRTFDRRMAASLSRKAARKSSSQS
ncbi:hypothetical protein [Novosphingobium aquimarinum]|uniref:hypothetical protein n=1 Tax=Novosphingobium aquimarinum TaxID=2682494 RepID=UPI0018DDB19A|nr:hypothetical protein [Novosphingobium aquimarinum]